MKCLIIFFYESFLYKTRLNGNPDFYKIMLLYQLTKKKKKKNYHNTNKNISRVRTKQRTSRVCVGYSGFGMEGLS